MSEAINNLNDEYKQMKKEATSREEKQQIKQDYKEMDELIKGADRLIKKHDEEIEEMNKKWDEFDFPNLDNFDEINLNLENDETLKKLDRQIEITKRQYEEQKKHSEEVMNKFDELKNKLDAKLGTTNSQEIYEVNNSKNNYSVEDISHNSTNDNKISLVVSNMLSDEVYDAINDLEMISLNLGEIEFFSRNEIDEAQKGFRFNPNTNEIINDWIGNNYIIIGYDCTAGFGPEPLIIKIDNPDYPIYWLMTEGGDWKKPIKVADSLTIFTTAYKKLLDYKTLLESNSLTAEECNSLILEIEKIVNSSNISWWKNLVMSSCL